MSKYSIEEFIRQNASPASTGSFFELENSKTLRINLTQKVLTKVGAMIAYTGNITFKKQGSTEQGLGMMFKKMVSGEGMTMMRAEGNGVLYCADGGKNVKVLHLQNQTISVNGNDVLALEESLSYDIVRLKASTGFVSGNAFNMKISGTGMVAISVHGDPLMLIVTPDKPVFTDGDATVAWDGGLQPEIKTDISWKDFIGKSSGESVQFAFRGNGWVLVQPYEEQPIATKE
ncbi:MAG: AIM24 family protein [Cytophagales bacterium]|nr:MAG: AIM24 family protein [Cytophagales bacterium]TAF60881.1 MAG: AIM24 family protein [Cytophagales bacterium]